MDNITALVRPGAKERGHAPRYVSKFRPMVLQDAKANKHAMKTMGPPNEELPDPRNYLRKHAGQLKFGRKLDVEHHIHTDEIKPKIPTRKVKPALKYPPTDFVKQAITQAYATVQPVPKLVINHQGDKVVLQNLGLPVHVRKKDYGSVPQYLQRHHAKEKKAAEVVKKAEEEVREAVAKEKTEEHQSALECLKKMWSSLMADYGRLPLIIERQTMIDHKLNLEEKLAWVEKNIQYIKNYRAKHPVQ